MKINGSWLRRQAFNEKKPKKKPLMVLVETSRTFPSRRAVQLIDWHILICFPDLGGWLWRQRTWNLWSFNVSSLLIYSKSLRKFLSNPFMSSSGLREKKNKNTCRECNIKWLVWCHDRPHAVQISKYGEKKLKSAYLSDFLCQGFLPFLLKVFGFRCWQCS